MNRVVELKQELFNEIWAKADAQDFEPSYLNDELETCAYRGKDGLRCNIGHLIPDDRYTGEIEGDGVKGGYVDENLCPVWSLTTAHDRAKERGFDKTERNLIRDFLSALQSAHDGEHTGGAHKSNLLFLANCEGLTVPVQS